MNSQSDDTEIDVTTIEQRWSRRRVMRLALVGAGAGLGARLDRVVAQDATPEQEPEPEADPEAGEGGGSEGASPVPGGTPVGSAGKTTIYSGRNENLIGPILARCEGLTGVDADIRYGDSPELAATLLEEGDRSPASLFISQDAGLLGLLAKEDRLAPLPAELLNRVDARFRSPDGHWVGVSGRARVAAYNTEKLTDADLPSSVLDLVDSRWKGTMGWAPGNASFQAFVTALRLLQGEDGARDWLEGMIANEPQVFDSNAPIVQAIGEGELELGLVNHYYVYEIKAEQGQDFPVANHFFAHGDPGSLINAAGLGILKSAPDAEQALSIAECLLRPEAQEYFARKTFEYPLIAGVEPAEGLPTLADIKGPDIDLSDLADLEGTQQLLTDVGLLYTAMNGGRTRQQSGRSTPRAPGSALPTLAASLAETAPSCRPLPVVFSSREDPC